MGAAQLPRDAGRRRVHVVLLESGFSIASCTEEEEYSFDKTERYAHAMFDAVPPCACLSLSARGRVMFGGGAAPEDRANRLV